MFIVFSLRLVVADVIARLAWNEQGQLDAAWSSPGILERDVAGVDTVEGQDQSSRGTPASPLSCRSCALHYTILTLGGCTTCSWRYGAPLLSKDMADGVAARCMSRSTSVTPFLFALQA